MKFIDIFKTIIIILIFGILYFSAIIAVGMKKLEEDWPKYRCVPTMMPFAGYLGKDTMSNFVYCVGNIQKDLMSYFLEPIQYVLGMVGGLGAWILERVQFIRVFITKLRSLITGIVGDIYGMFVNVLIQFQRDDNKFKRYDGKNCRINGHYYVSFTGCYVHRTKYICWTNRKHS